MASEVSLSLTWANILGSLLYVTPIERDGQVGTQVRSFIGEEGSQKVEGGKKVMERLM